MPDMQGRALRPPEGTREGCPYRGLRASGSLR
jgi:hypothetical protein